MDEDRWERFQANAEALGRQAAAARGSARDARGSDPAAAVIVGLDDDGRVEAVEIATDWRARLGGATLGDAVRAAVQAATISRLEAWGRAVSDLDGATGEPSPQLPDDFAHRLQQAASGDPTQETNAAVLHELLTVLQQVEQGLDEVSARLSTTLNQTLPGRSRDGQAQVTVTGGGELREVRYDRQWLRHAHAIDIARQTLAALRDAYAQVDRNGVAQLIAGSPLGAAQRAVQDPFGLARRMRLTD